MICDWMQMRFTRAKSDSKLYVGKGLSSEACTSSCRHAKSTTPRYEREFVCDDHRGAGARPSPRQQPARIRTRPLSAKRSLSQTGRLPLSTTRRTLPCTARRISHHTNPPSGPAPCMTLPASIHELGQFVATRVLSQLVEQASW